MTKYVIGPHVAIHLAHDEAVIRDEHQILARQLAHPVKDLVSVAPIALY
jgi:hypothetical protein